MKYRLGLDIGTNSIGWCLMKLGKGTGDGEASNRGNDELGPTGVIAMGARIFSDGRNPKDKTSLAVARRVARQMRRRRDRYLRRRKKLMQALIRHRLMPEDSAKRKVLELLDPYELRATGLDSSLTPHEFGRAIFHLGQRRGFKSNRKTDNADHKESGKIKQGVAALRAAIEESDARTLGEYLWHRHKDHVSVRARLRGDSKKDEAYELYPHRDMVAEEFDELWKRQASHHPGLLTDAARDEIRDILFFQRALKPVRPGKCTLEPGEERAPWALPLAQQFRIFQELNNLRVEMPGQGSRPVTIAERDRIAGDLLKGRRRTFEQIRRYLALDAEAAFNLQSDRRKHLDEDKTTKILAGKGAFGAAWHGFDVATRTEIVERLLSEQIEERLIAWLMAEYDLDAEAAEKIANARLPEGHTRFGRTALGKIVPIMRESVVTLDKAVVAADPRYHHADFRDGEIHDRLPYYGEVLERHVAFGSGEPGDPEEKRIGKLANPTVHIGLNQLRKVVNALIAEFGHPEEVVIELARELKMNKEQRDRIRKEQTDNQKANDARRARLIEIDQRDTGENRLRLRLWEELNPDNPLDRRCIYTGEPIGIPRLLSDEVEIDHILPFSKTLDNSFANKTVSLRRANRDKGNRSPYDAFHSSPPGYDWQKILGRVSSLAKNKRWRFDPDAMERFEEEGGFLDRQLTDTQYLTRISRQYMTAICDPNKVWAVPGRLTAMLRGRWGLNSLLSDANLKNRVDHRHHAIDAAVVAVTDRGLLQRIATAAARAEERRLERLLENMPEPWDGFRDDLRIALDRIVISHRPEHGIQGRLLEDTAYGVVADPAKEDGYNLVYRRPIAGLNANEVARIRDRAIRERLQRHIFEAEATGLSIKDALASFSKETGIRRVRLLKKERNTVPISTPDGKPYKSYSAGDNYCIDIIEQPDGKWVGKVITVFDANQPDLKPRRRSNHPDGTHIMRVHKGDLLRMDYGGIESIMRVVKLNPTSDRLWLCRHLDSGDLQKRHDDPDDSFRWALISYNSLKKSGARKVSVGVLGVRVRDPGPP